MFVGGGLGAVAVLLVIWIVVALWSGDSISDEARRSAASVVNRLQESESRAPAAGTASTPEDTIQLDPGEGRRAIRPQ